MANDTKLFSYPKAHLDLQICSSRLQLCKTVGSAMWTSHGQIIRLQLQ